MLNVGARMTVRKSKTVIGGSNKTHRLSDRSAPRTVSSQDLHGAIRLRAGEAEGLRSGARVKCCAGGQR